MLLDYLLGIYSGCALTIFSISIYYEESKISLTDMIYVFIISLVWPMQVIDIFFNDKDKQ